MTLIPNKFGEEYRGLDIEEEGVAEKRNEKEGRWEKEREKITNYSLVAEPKNNRKSII